MQLDDVITALVSRLADEPPPMRGDDELPTTYPAPPTYRPAAVLVPLVQHDGEVHVILTQRVADLQHHGGQISFPGGRVEAGDVDATHTALREAGEEIAMPAPSVRVLGRLGDYPTRTGFIITPVVGALASLPPLQPNPDEVASIFTQPLAFFADPAQRRVDQLIFQGHTHHFYAYDTPHGTVWGATAGILFGLTRLLV
jgi:8-oxo-dGTP pyrophosphatase MutT (NUDIX family)